MWGQEEYSKAECVWLSEMDAAMGRKGLQILAWCSQFPAYPTNTECKVQLGARATTEDLFNG